MYAMLMLKPNADYNVEICRQNTAQAYSLDCRRWPADHSQACDSVQPDCIVQRSRHYQEEQHPAQSLVHEVSACVRTYAPLQHLLITVIGFRIRALWLS